MPVAAGVVVAGWLGATGVTAAIVTGAVAGAITGCAIGAATAIVTKQNILQGALKGALIGGVSGGLINGLAEGISAGSSLGAAENAAREAGTAATNTTANVATNASAQTAGTETSKGLLSGGSPSVVAAPVTAAPVDPTEALRLANRADMMFMAKEGAKQTALYSGIGQAGAGLAQVAGAKMAADSKEKELKSQNEALANRIAGNIAYDQGRTLWTNITIPQIWTDRMTPTNISAPINEYSRPGLLEGGVA
jgi:hypothetical protein